MPPSVVQLLGQATTVLTTGGYQAVEPPAGWPASARIYEDLFGVVALHVYENWAQLYDGWKDDQSRLVEIISANIDRPDPKSWEGYLVLLTPGLVSDQQAIVDLRYDTNRVRKLVASADELQTLGDVRTALLPLLPLVVPQPVATGSGLLEQLPDLLFERGIDRRATTAALDAFSRNESVAEHLHQQRDQS